MDIRGIGQVADGNLPGRAEQLGMGGYVNSARVNEESEGTATVGFFTFSTR